MIVTSIRRGPHRDPPTPPVVAGRVPPSDLDAEAAVLSACLASADAIDEVADVVRPEHCYSMANRAVLDAVLALHAEGQAVDLVTVASRLRAADEMERVGGATYLAQLVDATPAVSHVREHASRVRELWRARRLIAACQVGAAEGYDSARDVPGFIDRVGSAVFDAIDATSGASTCERLSAIVHEVFRRKQARAEGTVEEARTGLVDFDRRLRACPGDLIIVAGRPGMGKSAFADHWATAIAATPVEKNGGTVLLFSLEMPKEQVAERMLATEARVELSRMRAWTISEVEQQAMVDAAVCVARLPLEIDDRSSATVLDVRAVARRIARRAARDNVPLRAIVIDYMQLMSGPGENREQQVSGIGRGLKALAKHLGVPVIALSQLNRANEKRGDRRPVLSDLRESGALEQDADAVIFVHRDDYYEPDCDTRGTVELIVAKQRNGPTGMVRARFWAACTRFDNLAPGEYADV